MPYRKFGSNDVFVNTMRAYPQVDFFVFDGKSYYNNIPEQSGSLEVSHKLIDSETPEGKKYIQENDVKGFPTVHVKKTDESGKTEVMDGPRGHEEMKKLLNDHGANIN